MKNEFVNYDQDETVGDDVIVCVKGGFLRYPDSNALRLLSFEKFVPFEVKF